MIAILHHTVSSRDRTKVQDIDDWHKTRWPKLKSSLGYYAGYHFVITGDGTLTQTRKLSEQGVHCPPNKGRIGIVLTGNFENEEPTKEQLTSLQALLEKLKKQGITKVLGHKDLKATLCPGRNLYKWLKKYKKMRILSERITILQRLISLYRKLIGKKK